MVNLEVSLVSSVCYFFGSFLLENPTFLSSPFCYSPRITRKNPTFPLQPPMSRHSSFFSSCFRPTPAADHGFSPSPLTGSYSGLTNLTTCLYRTHLAVFSFTWSRSLLARSLHVHFYAITPPFLSPPRSSSSFSSSSFDLYMKPFVFWQKRGSKKLSDDVRIFWDLSRAKFSHGPEPHSGFYIAAVVDCKMVLLVGDLTKEAYARTKSVKPQLPQSLVTKREHVVADRIYATKATIGGRTRDIGIDCGFNDDTKLCFTIDDKVILQITSLKWKFRGRERTEIDGLAVQVSWDVYNWIFEDQKNDGHAIFLFKFGEEEDDGESESASQRNGTLGWPPQQSWNLEMNEIEWRRARKGVSSSSVSASSVGSSSGSSSITEWCSTEETELSGGPSGFSLLIYAWKK